MSPKPRQTVSGVRNASDFCKVITLTLLGDVGTPNAVTNASKQSILLKEYPLPGL